MVALEFYYIAAGELGGVFVETNKEPFIPWALRLPFMVGTIGLIVGVK